MKKILYIIGLISLPIFSFSQNERDIPLKWEKSSYDETFLRTVLSKQDYWEKFEKKNGDWKVDWNTLTQTPHRAYGKSIPIKGFNKIENDNIEVASRQFILEELVSMGLDPENLIFKNAIRANNIWYVTFIQVFQGIEVYFSELELRITDDAKVMAFGFDYFGQIPIETEPIISYSEAKVRSQTGLGKIEAINSTNKLIILPSIINNAYKFNLAYFFEVTNNEGIKYDSFVDAHDGKIVWRTSNLLHAQDSVAVVGLVTEELPSGPFSFLPLANQRVTVDNNEITTDTNGYFSYETNEDSIDVTASLSGPFVRVNNLDGTDAFISLRLKAGDSLVVKWDDSNSFRDERNAFYHTNIAHDTLKKIDPGATYMDFQLTVNVRRGGTCNPNNNGTSISYDKEGGGCVSGANIANVNYHEYAHIINTQLYRVRGRSGMANMALHEATADIYGVLILDDPVFAPGWTGIGTSTRQLNVLRRYPDDVNSSPQQTGLILSGAFWELRNTISRDVALRLSHFAKYGTPDDPDVGVAFREYYLETLIADDDDGDLSNSTPHFPEIKAAFNKRRIDLPGDGTITSLSEELHSKLLVYPNPSNGEINFSFTLDEATTVEITFYNENGQAVVTISKHFEQSGPQRISWNWLRSLNGQVQGKLLHYILRAGKKEKSGRIFLKNY